MIRVVIDTDVRNDVGCSRARELLRKINAFRQRRQANIRQLLNMLRLTIIMHIVHDCRQLRALTVVAAALFLRVDLNALAGRGETADRKALDIAVHRLFRCPAVGGLEQLEDLVIANLQIGAPRLLDLRGERGLEHLVTVLLTLNLQAKLEA